MLSSYRAGNWTVSTQKILNYISEENKQDRHPKIKDVLSGTLRNWAYILIKSGYLTDVNALNLTPSGHELLIELTNNPPKKRSRHQRGISVGNYNPTSSNVAKTVTPVYRVTIEGKARIFQADIEERLAIQLIDSILKKKQKE